MNVPGIHRWRRMVGRLWKRPEHSGLVLMYHRVAEGGTDPWSLCVSPTHFAEHLEVLRSGGHPLKLHQIASPLKRGRLKRRTLALTFDDGYADNFHAARPLLERHEVPATFFITTGVVVDREHELWWDELDRLLLQPGTLPDVIRLILDGRERTWRLGESAHYDEAAFRRHKRWTAESAAPTARHALFLELWQHLYPLSEPDKQSILEALRLETGAGIGVRPTHRAMSGREIAEVGRAGLFEIGAHSVTHPPLPERPPAQQRGEIEGSKAFLEDVLGERVVSFSYPHGKCADATVAAVRDAGFNCACVDTGGPLRQDADAFRLPRAMVLDWDGDEFGKWLRGWQLQ